MEVIFTPKKSYIENEELETNAIGTFTSLLPKKMVKHYIKTGDKEPNIDGYLELLDNNGYLKSKVTVQVKHYPVADYGQDRFSIPQYVLGYADRLPSEVVLLIAVDTFNKKAYWKEISSQYIAECTQKGPQGTFTYYFKDYEVLTSDNPSETFATWHKLYQKRVASFKTEKENAENEVKLAATAFNSISTTFYGLDNSYLERPQVQEIYDWVHKDLTDQDSKLALVIGEAGMGKSVILKQVLKQLDNKEIPTFAIKADMHSSEEDITYQMLSNTLYILLSGCDKGVLLIDQIDALSQHLSNDRTLLNHYISMINTFMEESHKDVRIIVSCRRFDLKNDPIISTLKPKSLIVDVNLLELQEVESTLSLLGIDMKELNEHTCQLLRTPQHLDIFCRIYKNNKQLTNYRSTHALYNELWNQVVYHIDCKLNIDSENLEEYLFNIARRIREKGTLSPYWPTNAKSKKFTDYLSTQGLVEYDGKRLRFFHQSFYDFTLAKYYCVNEILMSEQLAEEHQGLFIRSTVKFVLEYLRGENRDLYKKEIRKLLIENNNTRFHINLLLFQIIGCQKHPEDFEKKIILDLEKQSDDLFHHFLSQATAHAWLDILYEVVCEKISADLDTKDSKHVGLIEFATTKSDECPVKVFSILSNIKDSGIKSWAYWKALNKTRDYTHPIVIESYKFINREDYRILGLAISSNPDFVVKKVEEILPTLINNKASKENNYEKGFSEFIDEVCMPLFEKAPQIIYPVVKKIVLDFIIRTKTNHWPDCLSSNYTFNSHDSEDEDKIIDFIVKHLTDIAEGCTEFVQTEVKHFYALKESSCARIVFKVIANAPKAMFPILGDILKDVDYVDKVLNLGSDRKIFLSAFKAIYKHSDKRHKRLINSDLQDYLDITEIDKKHKLELILSIPYINLTGKLRNERKNLIIDFPEEYARLTSNKQEVKWPDEFKGPSLKCCKKFNDNQWIEAILKVNTMKDSRFYSRDLRDCLSTVVKSSPKNHLELVREIFNSCNIPENFKATALIGLLEGNIPPLKTVDLFHQIVDINSLDLSIDSSQLIALYCKEDSDLIDEIIPILLKIIKSKYTQDKSITDEEKGSQSINRVINSIQGRALEVLIDLCKFPDRRRDIYNLLIQLKFEISADLYIGIFYYLSKGGYFDKEYIEQLVSVYISNSTSPIYLEVVPGLCQYLWYNFQEIIYNYFMNVFHENSIQHHLAAISFYGTAHDNSKEKSQFILEKIMTMNNSKAISSLIRVSCEYRTDTALSKLSKTILLKYMLDERQDIINTYIHSCSYLSPKDIDLFISIYDSIFKNLKNTDTGNILRYIKKSAINQPAKSFKILRSLSKLEFESDFYINEIIDQVLCCYNKIDDEEVELKEEIMDLFDMLLQNHSHRLDRILKEVDNLD